MDSLRYWVPEMHVDGFRFDLASTLAREFYEVDRLSAFFDLVQQDPVISQVKLIAEPWDVGEGGYQVGNFPPLWTEWNGKYRDTVRDFWRGEPATLGEFGYRLTGSVGPLRGRPAGRPVASINFVTAHDGFTAAPTWCATTRSTTRPTARTTATARATTGRGTAASRARPTTRRSSRCAPGSMRNLLDHAAAVAGRARCSRTATRWAAPSTATTTPTARTREISWVDWSTARGQRRPAGVHPHGCSRCARSHPVFRRRRFFGGNPMRSGEQEPRHRLADAAPAPR